MHWHRIWEECKQQHHMLLVPCALILFLTHIWLTFPLTGIPATILHHLTLSAQVKCGKWGLVRESQNIPDIPKNALQSDEFLCQINKIFQIHLPIIPDTTSTYKELLHNAHSSISLFTFYSLLRLISKSIQDYPKYLRWFSNTEDLKK